MQDRIDLAHEEPFRLGRLDVRPQLRQIVRDDGAQEILEPRVMQVLVALGRADGAILSREDLTRRCWEGRVVGEDAINRVISRLRRTAEGIGEDSFRIETVTKVGYRLLASQAGEPAPSAAPPPPGTTPADPDRAVLEKALRESHRLRLDRRAMLAGAGLAVVATGGFYGWRQWFADPDAPPADIAPLLEQARVAGRQGNMDGGNQATALLRRATEIRPDYANGWGLLAINYASLAGGVARDVAPAMRDRAKAAIDRALALDPDNAYARFAAAMLGRKMRNWRDDEMLAREILAKDPRNLMARNWLAGVLASVGRMREAADSLEVAAREGQSDPSFAYTRVVALWAAGRLDQADKASTEAHSLFPSHFGVWFTRFYFLMYTGRPSDALAMSANIQQRPTGFSDENFAMLDQMAHAMFTRAPAEVAAALKTAFEWAHRGAGYAENSMQFASALGDVDTAFRIADAYYFSRGFKTGENRFQLNQRVFTRIDDRRTRPLFLPSTAAMRADPRFEALVGELGLTAYWAKSGTLPDYKRS